MHLRHLACRDAVANVPAKPRFLQRIQQRVRPVGAVVRGDQHGGEAEREVVCYEFEQKWPFVLLARHQNRLAGQGFGDAVGGAHVPPFRSAG